MLYQFFFLCILMFSPLSADECPELTGTVVLPEHKGYEKAKLVSNYYTSKNSHPDTIVYCSTTQDVQNAVKHALCKKLPVRIRSGGHCHVKTLKDSQSPLLNVLLFSMGGASAEIAPEDSAYFYRKATSFVVYSTQWLKPEEDKKSITELDALRTRLLPYTEGDYIGNPDRSLKDYAKDYFGNNVERLRCVKRKYDPNNLFQFEQSIPPADKDCK